MDQNYKCTQCLTWKYGKISDIGEDLLYNAEIIVCEGSNNPIGNVLVLLTNKVLMTIK